MQAARGRGAPVEGVGGLPVGGVGWRYVRNHCCEAPAAERVLQQLREAAVAEGDVALPAGDLTGRLRRMRRVLASSMRRHGRGLVQKPKHQAKSASRGHSIHCTVPPRGCRDQHAAARLCAPLHQRVDARGEGEQALVDVCALGGARGPNVRRLCRCGPGRNRSVSLALRGRALQGFPRRSDKGW